MNWWEKAKAAAGLYALGMTAPLFPLSPILGPLLWNTSSTYRRMSDIAQGAYLSWFLGRRGTGSRKTLGAVGVPLALREGMRAVFLERLTRHSPFNH